MTRPTLTEGKIRRGARNTKIMLAYYDGLTQREIARKFKLSAGRVSQIIKAQRPQMEGTTS